MGSSYYGEPRLGNEKGGSSGSRKGKKGNTDKPKQPQRGLGVAQLEKIRLHGEMATADNYHHPSLHHHPYNPSEFNQEDMGMQTAYTSVQSSSSYGFHPNIMMGVGDYEGTNIRYGDCQPSNAASWNQSNSFIEAQQYAQPAGTTRDLLNLQIEGTQPKKNKKHRSNSVESNSQNSELSDSQELDLELRLSI